jgi:hypothetical protein
MPSWMGWMMGIQMFSGILGGLSNIFGWGPKQQPQQGASGGSYVQQPPEDPLLKAKHDLHELSSKVGIYLDNDGNVKYFLKDDPSKRADRPEDLFPGDKSPTDKTRASTKGADTPDPVVSGADSPNDGKGGIKYGIQQLEGEFSHKVTYGDSWDNIIETYYGIKPSDPGFNKVKQEFLAAQYNPEKGSVKQKPDGTYYSDAHNISGELKIPSSLAGHARIKNEATTVADANKLKTNQFYGAVHGDMNGYRNNIAYSVEYKGGKWIVIDEDKKKVAGTTEYDTQEDATAAKTKAETKANEKLAAENKENNK